MADHDPDIDLKKRARRRLVGAIALALLAAIVLPMVMDQSPPSALQPVELRIPGQDALIARPLDAVVPVSNDVAKLEPVAMAPADPAAGARNAAAKDRTAEEAAERAAVEKTAASREIVVRQASTEKATAQNSAKEVSKPASPKPAEAPVRELSGEREQALKGDAQKESARARAILAGQAGAPPGSVDPHVILIGAFSNPANVKTLQTKLGELGIKVYTEKLNSPQGEKTRVRAGPFTSRDAAEKALARMKRIGVDGVVAPRS